VFVIGLTTYPAGQGSGIHLLFNKTYPLRHLVQVFPTEHFEHLSTPHGLQTLLSFEKVPSGHADKHFPLNNLYGLLQVVHKLILVGEQVLHVGLQLTHFPAISTVPDGHGETQYEL
jgi:hypothetical protein